MTWQLIVLWSLASIASVHDPLFLVRTLPDPPIDPVAKPQPDPWRVPIAVALGIVGGIAGGWAFYSTWIGHERVLGLEAASTAVGAYLGAKLLSGVYHLATQRQPTGAPRPTLTR